MIRVLAFLAALAVLAAGAAWLVDRPGDVAVVWQGYRIETSVAVAFVAVLAIAVVLMLLWTLARFIFRVPDVMTLASRNRRRSKGFSALSRGMVAVGAGDPASARRYAADAERLLGREPLTLLLKAQAAQIDGDRAGAEAAFNTMLESPETRVLGLRGLYVEAKRKGDDTAARGHAAKAAQLAPTVGWANEAVLEYLCAEHNWQGALGALERRASLRHVDKDEARRQRAVLLTADALDRADKDTDGALDAAQQAVKLAPDLVPAAALAGRLLARQGALRKAARLLEASWKATPHPDLAVAYVDLRAGDSALDRLERAQTLLRLVPGQMEGRIAVARAALDAREFGTARRVLSPLLYDRPTVRVCLLMAELEEAEHAAEGAVREWLARASRAPRDPAWIADGVISDHWSPVSPVTGRLDAYVWTTPTELIAHTVDADHPDDVLADGNEAPAWRPLPAPAPQPEPKPAASTIEAAATTAPPTEAAPADPAPSAPAAAGNGVDRPAAEPIAAPAPSGATTAAPATAAGAGRAAVGPQPGTITPVIFPVPHPPDDPGPEADNPPRPRMHG
ncbi:heme biosynthesis protein HemY [Chelatococcus reniformis]|uniref:Heme biosynthesis protein HemY n=1 Tax=Chelatococcus reniformis TaxID=1494448 RepID=A0A916TXW4_9HYPH|nr:heme biosynthesis HemY N-terminal domain-containing protein [Chelatococcus reniformis]GGC49980.1 heme biosynthesis protein HemY [Chelatococcus reniformis]